MPFNTDQFLDVFASYNEKVFPMQIVLLVAALVAVRLATNGDSLSSKTVAGVLGFFWLWIGLVYHFLFFSQINSAAIVFGAFSILEGGIFFYSGVIRKELTFRDQSRGRRMIGTALIVYSLLIYPIAGTSLGHGYPYSPTFGSPCPTTIFTFGLLLRSGRKVPFYVLPIPFMWSLVGTSGAFLLDIWEDLVLVASALIGAGLLISFHPLKRFRVGASFGLKEN